MSWASFISAGVGIWAKKATAALGVGFITFVGFQAVKQELANLIQSSWGGLPVKVYQVLALGGFVDGVGIWLGAVTTVITLVTVKRLGVLQS